MRNMNGRLIAVVASVAVAAVVIGAALAYRQGPESAQANAAPLTGTPSITPSQTPSSTPSTPANTPSTVPPASTKSTVDVNKLAEGRAPQVPYLIGREVRSGEQSLGKIPGKGGVLSVGQLRGAVLAVTMYEPDGDGTELLKVESGKLVRRTPDVSSLVTTSDTAAAAYAASRLSSLGVTNKGGTVYAETADSVQSLKLPNSWEVRVLAYADGKVYYRASDTETGPGKLYSWVPGEAKGQLIKAVISPTAVSANGSTAAAQVVRNDFGTCSNVVQVPRGTQLFRTCDFQVRGFTPNGATAYGDEHNAEGFCSGIAAAFESSSGKVFHQWKGCFQEMGSEDDQHILIVAYASPVGQTEKIRTAIIRCTISTGACERATPIGTDTPLDIGS
ncbi:hypothetical protein E1263_24375 [Kribbella antibiotica]|uniref:Uncharacterized protein n=1 Tax=Kribbella antibiotica TaxID=190195 RepID=A0A4R4ZF19_9ACTN|nr:hypothetical protein [Kribbella antibiotica]TDD57128.1 hypothetical protein E1263_24375 [Kribbella antibiotica]